MFGLKEKVNSLIKTAKDGIHQAVKQSTPVIQKEISKITSKTADDILDSALKIALGIGTVAALCVTLGKPILSSSEVAREISVVYNEVKVENLTINLKGD